MSNKNSPGATIGNKLRAGGLSADTEGRAIIADGFFSVAKERSAFAEAKFHVTGTITSAAAATAVTLIADADVPTGKKIYVQGFIAKVDGATVWATTATVKIQDSNSSAVGFVTMAVAALTGNAVVGPHVADITCEDAFSEGTGGTASKGLQLKGNANGTGSDLKVTVWGIIK